MPPVDMLEYQRECGRHAFYPGRGKALGLSYITHGLTGEAGEIANKVKKMLRDDDMRLTPERHEQLVSEAGDVLWYLAMLAEELGVPLSVIAERGLEKLAARRERGTLAGEGDER